MTARDRSHSPVDYVLLLSAAAIYGSVFTVNKIAAIGVRLRHWVSFHGISINVAPDLAHFAAIVPCGVVDPRYGVTSFADLGYPVTMTDVDVALRQAFEQVFGAVEARSPAATG